MEFFKFRLQMSRQVCKYDLETNNLRANPYSYHSKA